MRKAFLIIFFALISVNMLLAQTKSTKIGYIDMEYILQNVPNYIEAQNQLEQKAQTWKQEIEAKKNDVNKLRDALKAEKALLTKSLIEERNSEIAFLETEILDYQQKRFGPYGDLMTQKDGLTKPIQDQVFTAVQDIAEAKKYDFIFDKTSDLTMLFAAKRYDISDQIVQILNRTEKREQLTKKQLQEQEAKEAKEDASTDKNSLSERQKALDAKKLERETLIATKKLADEERRKTAEEKRLQIVADRETKKNTGNTATDKTASSAGNPTEKEAAIAAAAEIKKAQAEARAKTLEDRKKQAEENKKAQEQKRKEALEAKQSKKTGTVSDTDSNIDKKNEGSVTDGATPSEKTFSNETTTKSAAEIERQKQADARSKALEERKKALDEKRKKILEDRELTKKANEEKLKTTKENTNNN